MSDSTRILRDYGSTVVIAVLIAVAIRFFVIEAYRIPSQAMRPTLEAGDTIFVAKWPFGLHFPGAADSLTQGRLPERGEVVVFSSPSDQRRDYIKRVVGMPGETVEIKAGHLLLNGTEMTFSRQSSTCGTESLPDGMSIPACWEPPLMEDFPKVTVPRDSVFVIGDFRARNSGNHGAEKTWGLVPRSMLRGKALWIWLSVETQASGESGSWFPRFRFDRMFKRIT